MKKISIVFSSRKGIVPWIIRKYLGTPYNHVCLSFKDPRSKRQVVFESDHEGVTCLTQERWSREGNKIVKGYNLEVTTKRFNEIWTFLIDNLQVDYGYKTLIRELFGKDKTGDGLICSQLVSKALNIEFQGLNRKSGIITPDEIEQLLEAFK